MPATISRFCPACACNLPELCGARICIDFLGLASSGVASAGDIGKAGRWQNPLRE
jgi:hypothetical protein